MIDKQYSDAFREELDALLTKYKARIYATDEYPGYPECGQELHIYVETVWEPSNEIEDPELYLDLGDSYSWDELNRESKSL